VEFANWLAETSASKLILKYSWVWPAAQTLHFVGLALLVGVVGLLDLRLLGFGKGLPFSQLNRLVPWALLGFATNLITGALFFVGDPRTYVDNTAFYLKMLLIVIGGVNVFVFQLNYYSKVKALGPGSDAPLGAKIVATISLCLWIGVMYFGRMLPYFDESFRY
jgi:hypothetical protein